jgi:hypothetical protein
VKFQFGLLLNRSGVPAPVFRGRASETSRDIAQPRRELATSDRAGQNLDVNLLFGLGPKFKAPGWSQGVVSPKLRANPSLNVTRYGGQRLAAPGASGHFPSAAKRRPPSRSR